MGLPSALLPPFWQHRGVDTIRRSISLLPAVKYEAVEYELATVGAGVGDEEDPKRSCFGGYQERK